jgi:DNA-directed RNA polymerase specialized sigma24 family protein
MPPQNDAPRPSWTEPGTFRTTHWSVVLAARAGADTRATAALETLCRTYWYPLYAFVRRQGYAAEDAQDLTQGFFARLLEKDYLTAVDPAKGRFRSFLLAAIKQLNMSEGAVRMAVSRLRRRYAELFRAEVANTEDDSGRRIGLERDGASLSR